jgi:polysaccharide biosynthesis transport protein
VREFELGGPSLQRYLKVAWRSRWLLLAIVILVPVAVYAISSQLTKTYEAKITLFVQSTSIATPPFSEETAVSTSSPENVVRLIDTPLVANLAARNLGEPQRGARALLEKVNAELDPTLDSESESNFLTVSARDGDPQRAADIAGAFAEAVSARRAREARRTIDRTLRDLNRNADALSGLGPAARQDLADEIRQLEALRSSQLGGTRVVDPVVVPMSPISPRPLRNAVLGFIFAVLLAAGLVPLRDRLDRKVREADELEPLLGSPVLAGIPDQAFPGNPQGPSVREAFQTLRASLTYFNVDRALERVLVASPTAGDGKTTVATNLAVALAQDERDVILIDADLRQGKVAERIGVEAAIGLDAVLLEERQIEEALIEVPGLAGGRLWVLPTVSPPPNPSVLLSSNRMRALLEELSHRSDVVVIDAPPLLGVSDAIPLLEQVSGILVVARIGYTDRDALTKMRNVISTANGTILGAAATGTRTGGLYGYDLYGYEGPEPQPEPPAAFHSAESANGNRSRLGDLLRRGERQKQRSS